MRVQVFRHVQSVDQVGTLLNKNIKSTIRVDFAGIDNQDSFQPVIRVNLQDSEDVRDGLLKSFFQALGGESSWLAVDYHEDTIDGVKQPKRITIYPVRPDEFEETINLIRNRMPPIKEISPEEQFNNEIENATGLKLGIDFGFMMGTMSPYIGIPIKGMYSSMHTEGFEVWKRSVTKGTRRIMLTPKTIEESKAQIIEFLLS